MLVKPQVNHVESAPTTLNAYTTGDTKGNVTLTLKLDDVADVKEYDHGLTINSTARVNCHNKSSSTYKKPHISTRRSCSNGIKVRNL